MSSQHSHTESSSPVYTHDCDRCKFLGHFDGADLYFCEQNPRIGPTVLARYGNAGHQYTSGIGATRHNLWLNQAYVRASDQGLLSDEQGGERFALSSKVRVQQADALIEALTDDEQVGEKR